MIITAYRIVQSKHSASALDGEGARLYGGRWNSPGVSVVYLASSLSLATLELMVHLDDYDQLKAKYSWIQVQFPHYLVGKISTSHLKSGWRSPSPRRISQHVGDLWIKEKRSAILSVPDAIVPSEYNYLINPNHSHAGKISVGKPAKFVPDKRLIK